MNVKHVPPKILEKIPSATDILGQQLVQERLNRMKADQAIDAMGAEIVSMKLEIMRLKGGTTA